MPVVSSRPEPAAPDSAEADIPRQQGCSVSFPPHGLEIPNELILARGGGWWVGGRLLASWGQATETQHGQEQAPATLSG